MCFVTCFAEVSLLLKTLLGQEMHQEGWTYIAYPVLIIDQWEKTL